MLVVYEFEVFEGDEYYIACPFDMDGATQGATYEEVAEMAVDWLRLDIEHRAMHGLPIPSPTFRNSTQHGGERMLVAVDAGLETIPRMTMAEAARRLGVTRGRVSQMVEANQLEVFEMDGRRWVTGYSVDARIKEQPRVGRPRKEALST